MEWMIADLILQAKSFLRKVALLPGNYLLKHLLLCLLIVLHLKRLPQASQQEEH
jgi:hypothetical protein